MHAVHTTGDHTTSGVLGSYPLELLGVLVLYYGYEGSHLYMTSGTSSLHLTSLSTPARCLTAGGDVCTSDTTRDTVRHDCKEWYLCPLPGILLVRWWYGDIYLWTCDPRSIPVSQ